MPLAQATRDELKKFYNALADRILEPGDPVYVAQVNCQGNDDVVETIATEVEWQQGGGVCQGNAEPARARS